MTLEEKAKAYDEAIKKAAALYKTSEPMSGCNVIIETLFPELKESEDEKIRKEIIRFIQMEVEDEIVGNKWLAWLEKQGRHKPIDKVEPNFHEGDWVVYKCDVCQIIKREEGCNKLVTNFGIEKEFVNERNLSTARLWAIQDAKDGDVLVSQYNKPFIYNGNHDSLHIGSYCGISVVDRFNVATEKCHWTENANIQPATKEQRTELFLKMHEAGYEWDANKKKLVIIKDDINKPKFNIGDWITNGIDVNKIIGIDLEDENYLFENGRKSDISLVDSNSHLWTIEDAKDGDILAVEPIDGYPSSFIAIFKKPDEEDFDSYCFIGFDGIFYEGEEGHSTENIHPATKEQCLLLFQKMHEAGYEWDDEKKELKKIKANEAMYDDDKLREAICE